MSICWYLCVLPVLHRPEVVDIGVNTIYTQLQKKPISHFSGQLWKTEWRNENRLIPYSLTISSAVYIKVHYRLDFFKEANNMNPDQSDLGSYCSVACEAGLTHIGIMSPWTAATVLSQFWFLIDNFWRVASIYFKVYRWIKHLKIQVKLELGCHLQHFDAVMVLFYLDFG